MSMNNAPLESLVPSWLTGTWTRSYIRRRIVPGPGPNGDGDGGGSSGSSGRALSLGKPDSTVEVTYIQTPWAFVDVRRPPVLIDGSKEVAMAFAGVTTVLHGNDSGGDNDDRSNSNSNSNENETPLPPLVNWHTCLEMDSPEIDSLKLWSEADAGKPRETPDKGYFKDVSEEVGIPHTYRETDPDGTLEELWIRVDDGNNQFLAARNEKANVLLVVAGKHFGYANQDKNMFVLGVVSSKSEEGLVILMSASDKSLEGTTLSLEQTGWTILAGSTIDIKTIIL